MSARVYEFGPFRLDADKTVLWRDGEVVPLTPKGLALGEREGALDELERAADVRDPWIVLLAADTALDELRGEARFEGLVERVHGRA